MNYCKNCKRFVSATFVNCPLCGSEFLKSLIFDGENVQLSVIEKKICKIILNKKKFDVNRVIGVGGYGVILEVTGTKRESSFALKLPLTFDQYFSNGREYSRIELKNSEDSIADEIKTLKKIKGKRIIKVIDSGVASVCGKKKEKEFSAILMEKAICTLKDIILLEESGKIEISIREKIYMIGQIIENLVDLHESGVIHRDIAPENIFVVDRGRKIEYVIADFGTSRETELKSGRKTTGIVGRDKYLDPHRFNKQYSRDPRIDIYTTGIVITEILIGNLWDNIIFEPLYDIDFEKEFLKNYASIRIDKRLIKFISKAIKPDIGKRYKSAREMKKSFDKVTGKMFGGKVERKIVRSVDLIYNIKVPDGINPKGEETVINLKNHKKINIGINDITKIVIEGAIIKKTKLVNTPFFKARIKGESVILEPNKDKIGKEFKFFYKSKFKNDRGILYFNGRLIVEIIPGSEFGVVPVQV